MFPKCGAPEAAVHSLAARHRGWRCPPAGPQLSSTAVEVSIRTHVQHRLQVTTGADTSLFGCQSEEIQMSCGFVKTACKCQQPRRRNDPHPQDVQVQMSKAGTHVGRTTWIREYTLSII